MKERGCKVINASGDADVPIARAAVEASVEQVTTVIGEDTDLLILLLFHARLEGKGLYFKSDRSKADDKTKVFDIIKMKEIIGNAICGQLLFVHAMTGCDSTSRIFGIGKKTAFLKLQKEIQL